MKKLLLILPVFVLGFISCSEDDEVDTSKPTIVLVSPADDEVFHPGETIELVCDFGDNDELKSFKVDIHSNSDSHEHAAYQLKSGSEEDHGEAWDFEQTWTFEAGLKTKRVEEDIVIPLTIAHEGEDEEVAEGHYHVGIYCLDVAGNQSEYFIEIEIEHDDH